jgi:uncharacterized protein YaaR (DUF327 family)
MAPKKLDRKQGSPNDSKRRKSGNSVRRKGSNVCTDVEVHTTPKQAPVNSATDSSTTPDSHSSPTERPHKKTKVSSDNGSPSKNTRSTKDGPDKENIDKDGNKEDANTKKELFGRQALKEDYSLLNEAEHSVLVQYFRRTLFTKVKFIDNKMLSMNTNIIAECYKKISCTDSNEQQKKYIGIVRLMKETLNSRRGYVSEKTRDTMKGKIKFCSVDPIKNTILTSFLLHRLFQ